MTSKQVITRLNRLCDLIWHHKNEWGEIPTNRMIKWMTEYNNLKSDYKSEWIEYCNMNNAVTDHYAFDLLA